MNKLLDLHIKTLERLQRRMRLFLALSVIAFAGWLLQTFVVETIASLHSWLLLLRIAWWLVFLGLMARVFYSCLIEIRAWIRAAQAVIEEYEVNVERLRAQNNELIQMVRAIRRVRRPRLGSARSDEEVLGS